MPQPLVSVIVPSYNHALFITDRLRSVLEQSYQNFEVIILDDHSEDNTITEINPFLSDTRAHLTVNEANSGSPFRQWYKGIQMARGKYIWVAESDDYADRSFLERMVPAMECTCVAVAYCRSTDIDKLSRSLGPSDDHVNLSGAKFLGGDVYTFSERKYFIASGLVEKNSIVNASAVLFKTEIIKRFIYSAIGYRYLGDWLLYVLSINEGGVALVDKPLNFFRVHDTTTRYSKKRPEEWEVLKNEYLCIYHLLRQIGIIDSTRHSQLCTHTSTKIFNRARFDSSFDVGVIIRKLHPHQKIIIWGAGTIGSFIAETLITAGVSASCIAFIDSARRSLNIQGKNYYSSPADDYLRNLKNPNDSLLILATLESSEIMLKKIQEIRLNIPILSAATFVN
jgi:glycosyltransferase involved in cell wall biosynthesis